MQRNRSADQEEHKDWLDSLLGITFNSWLGSTDDVGYGESSDDDSDNIDGR